jgi:enoyl-CoA hydratase
MSEDLLYKVQDGIGRITFNRPQARNSFTFEMYEKLRTICSEAGNDKSVRVLILSGVDDTSFAAGTDISQFRSFSSGDDVMAYEERIESVISALERCPIPTIAAIAGACTGGGFTIAGCCDLRIGAKNSRFGVPISRTLGNCLSMSNYLRVVALLGTARAQDILFTARLMDAEEAHRVGLLGELLPDFPALQRRAEELARTIASHAPLTLRVTKESLRRIKERMNPGEERELILSCYLSNDFREGMDAFLAKRKPKWSGT